MCQEVATVGRARNMIQDEVKVRPCLAVCNDSKPGGAEQQQYLVPRTTVAHRCAATPNALQYSDDSMSKNKDVQVWVFEVALSPCTI